MTTERERELSRIRNRRYSAKNRESLNEKSRAWYAANKDKAKETRRKWREVNAEKDKADIHRYQQENKEHLAAKSKEWQLANLEKVKASTARYTRKNHVKVLESGRLWRQANRDRVNAKKAHREARKLLATPSWSNPEAIRELYRAAHAATEIFETPIHVDHVVPLKSKWVCGLHCESNLRLLPGILNQQKSNRHWPDMPESLSA